MAPFHPEDLTGLGSLPTYPLPDDTWLPVLEHTCDFSPHIFESVSLNLIRNPNINSTHLFRADVLFDSHNGELTNIHLPQTETDALLRRDGDRFEAPAGYQLARTIVRLMIPRNPQLDKPIAQTCYILHSTSPLGLDQRLVIYVPHADQLDELPWYHPTVRSVAYLYSWRPPDTDHSSASLPLQKSTAIISLHYRLFPSQTLPLSARLLRTAYHLLSILYKHGQGALAGYTKRVHHDQMISQQRVQDMYADLKRKHAKRLCDNWVEKTEPSKHVFEDLGIAAFLIELWKDMYRRSGREEGKEKKPNEEGKDPFPGFVDIGCGNGILVDVLLREGYRGWGFDARRRKTWSTFSITVQGHLKELILVPQPLLDLQPPPDTPNTNPSKLSRTLATFSLSRPPSPLSFDHHTGIFPQGTFIISNHADELTPWTPLLASLSRSPFLAIPCCSHNLSGSRFRAPSSFNSYSADVSAPSYFAANINSAKSVAISVAGASSPVTSPSSEVPPTPSGPERGDLNALSQNSRSKQPSAYASLCDWVSQLMSECGYGVEKEMLRIPSTRNVGLVGRVHRSGFGGESLEIRQERVRKIARREGAELGVWLERAKGLKIGEGNIH
ncbi:MAG: et-dependent methyltransferase [Lasallia pustulata]|uniref:tRNA (uracil-O(2)-)-methyltransferase n=1 Tax=Lasallia pustulata TaxID=136370 RepID=A0A5M8PYB6_9LECA|nr:MAG: et-dependent methyltransferase [Lasallia pustulata]